MFFLRTFICVYLLLLASALNAHAQAIPEDKNKAVILAYHRIGEDLYPQTNLRVEQFKAHIKEIENGGYTVISLEHALQSMKNNTPLPPKALVITFEGAYKSALEQAVPILTERYWPFTVLYSAGKADTKSPSHANWQDLKTLKKNKNVTLGTLPYTFDRMTNLSETEQLSSINRARQRHREEFNEEAQIFSYPFGEYSFALQKMIKTQGYETALTINSGALHAQSNIFALPRFSMTESYGSIERFQLVANALPLPVTEFEPLDVMVSSSNLNVGFTLSNALKNDISCFLSGAPNLQTERLNQRIEIRGVIQENRARLNCTMEGPLDENDQVQWRWLGKLFHRSQKINNNIQ